MNTTSDRAAGIPAAEDIAIVGMACVLPGSDTLARYWQNIVDKVSSIGEPPPDWQPEHFTDPEGKQPDKLYIARGGFLGDLSRFEPAKYGIMPSSIDGAEPDQFLAFRCAVEAMEDAGFPGKPLERQKAGVIIGRGIFVNRGMMTMFTNGYMLDEVIQLLRKLEPDRSESDLALIRAELKKNLPPFNAETVPGLTHNILAGRIANRLDLQGPAYMVDAACASTLLAVEQGMRELRSGSCDLIIAGGVQVSNPGMVHQAFCYLEALSKSGQVAPFSAGANGTLLGQGCGALVLMRRSDAERDGHRIYGLVKAVGVSSDGKGSGILAPRKEGQVLSLRRAYEQAGLSPDTVGLIEAHGTGIPLGDATEIGSLGECFGPRSAERPTVAVGSVKSMISHLIPASGAASLIKTALALYHRVLPPTLNADEPNPALGLDRTPFYLSSTTRPWIHAGETPRRAGVNAFGFGGINAHAILEEYTPEDEQALPRLERDWPVELVVLRAADCSQLQNRVERLQQWLEGAPATSLLDVAASAAQQTGPCRLALVARSIADLQKKLASAAKQLADPARDKIQDRGGIFWYAEPMAEQGRVAFVFPGEGAQYTNMLADLCRHFPEVRREFDRTDRAFLRSRVGRPLSRLIYPLPSEAKQAEQELLSLGGAVTSVTLAERAQLALLKTLGLKADAILGHSSGEFGALMAAGAIAPPTEEALIQALADGADNALDLAQSGLVADAVLLAVGGADRAAVERVVAESHGCLKIAMDNCPSQLVLSGDEESAEAALAGLRGKGGLVERLPWGRAYHTEGFLPAVSIIEKFYNSFGIHSPQVELWSCATADRYPSDPEAVRELALRQWSSSVRFRETIEAMYADGVRIFVEVGPRGNLTNFIGDTLQDRPHAAVALDAHRKSSIEQLCRALGLLAAHGVPFDLAALYSRRSPRLLDLSMAPPAAPRVAPRLKLELPELKLSDDILSQVQRKPSLAMAVPASATVETLRSVSPPLPAPAGAPNPAPALESMEAGSAMRVHVPPAPQPVLAPPITAPITTPSSTPVAAAGAGPDARLRAFQQYQQTMRQFLELQRKAMLVGAGQVSAGLINPAQANGTGSAVVAPPVATAPSQSVPVAAVPSTAAPASPAPVSSNGHGETPGAAANGNGHGSHGTNGSKHSHAVPATAPSSKPRASQSKGAAPSTPRFQTNGGSKDATRDPRSFNDRLLEIVSQRTGYPSDMLDLDANLEADLGIDSIKRVEVIGAFRRAVLPSLDQLADAVMERLTSATTLRAILDTVIDLTRDSFEAVATRPLDPALLAPLRVRPAAMPDARLPFIEHVLLHEPHERLIVECDLDVERHRFLKDHTFFGRQVSDQEPTLFTLPVMPLAMTLELMAEAAQKLLPDLRVVAIEKVRTTRWLAFETDTRRVRMEATLEDEAHIRVVISEADREGYSAGIATGTVEMGYGETELGPPIIADEAQSPAPWAHGLYDRILFHGPAFQGIDQLEACDERAVRARIHEPDPKLMLREDVRGQLLLPVGLIDVATQVPGMKYGDWKPTDAEVHMVYPNSFERLEFVERRVPNEPLDCVSQIRRDGQYLHTDLEVKNSDNRVVLRYTGRVCQVVDFPTGIHHYSKSPREVTCSRDITEAFAGVPGIEHVTITEIGHATGPALLNRLWSQALARMVLGSDERRLFSDLKLPPASAASWLIGRIVAKDAVRLRTGQTTLMADIGIIPNSDGRPEVRLREQNVPTISLAHKDFAAVAVAGDAQQLTGVGIDIESLGAMYPGLVDDSFNTQERALIDAAARQSGEPFDNWRLAAWAAKESVGKALGRGVLGGPRSVEVLEVDVATGRMALALRGQMAKAFRAWAPSPDKAVPIYAYRRVRGPYVIALCLLKPWE
jgi:acyl transferase domain-containing protein/phosphopantetheinyl transferase